MTEIFTKVIQNGLTPNSFYVLYCIKEKIVPHNSINKALECKRLQTDHWLTESLELTDKSIIFMAEIDGYFKKSKKKTSKDLMGHNFMQNIEAYVNIFPNKKLSSGKYARVPAKNLENAFRWFFENYSYDWETIFLATQKYVSENENGYMRTSQYFVRKQNSDKTWDSDLSVSCEYIINSPDEDDDVFSELIV